MAITEDAAADAARAARNADLYRLLAVLTDEAFESPAFSALVPEDPGSAWDTAAAGRYALDLHGLRAMVVGLQAAARSLAAAARDELARS